MNKLNFEDFKKKAQSIEASKLVKVIAGGIGGSSSDKECHPDERC
ncbi:hypothetical protein [Flavobacterium crassostreae]|nr:hypothetical protein [Flavobacterium crassostreae]